MPEKDPTSLFSGRVENYIKYRPGYSSSLIPLLKSRCGLSAGHVIADIGSGTGILTELFLRNGNPVYAVEPNEEMRKAAESLLGSYPNFISVAARAEDSSLSPASVDIVTAGQSFHWFDRLAARKEFLRILKTGGWVVLTWNSARTDTPFLQAYDEFWRTSLKGARGSREDENDDVTTFFTGSHFERVVLEGDQRDFDWEDFRGRVLSISMSVQPGEPGHEAFMDTVRDMFNRHQEEGLVRLSYDTEVIIGHLST